MFDNIISDMIGGFARHIATATGGYLLAQGLISAQDEQSYIGSVIFLIGLAWSVCQKYSKRKTA